MSGLIDFSNPMIRAMVFVQVIGFPLAFLVRAGIHAFKARRQVVPTKTISLIRVAYYVCFALMSVSFYYFRPAGVLFLAVGIGLLVWQNMLTRKSSAVDIKMPHPHKPISIRATRLSKR